MPVLRLKNLSKNFGKVRALSGINLEIKEGTFCVILGPSGCGKSTLLNLIAGLEEPSEGKIYLGEKEITILPPQKRNIAMVFQNYALYPHLSAYENIAFGLRVKKEGEDKIREKIKKVSRILDIENKLQKLPRELSGGERQRVATGRAIVRNPELFLFDEPLSNLDARLRIELRGEFIKLHRRLEKTIIYVTHDQVEAMVLGQEVVVLKGGRVQQVSSPEELYHNPRNLFVAGFIGTPPMNIIPLKVEKLNNDIRLVKDKFRFEVPENLKEPLEEYVAKDVYFGFRPSVAKITEKGQIKGETLFVETMGEDSFAHIKVHPRIEITVKVEEINKPQSQEAVSVTIDNNKVYLFSPDGMRIEP